jgi:hypothetical protein
MTVAGKTASMALVVASVIASGGCHAKPDLEDRCHDIAEHWRKVSAMPMREGDVRMFMGACMMWKASTLECMEAAMSDADIAKCREMEK